MSIIAIQNLSFSYPEASSPALKDINLHIEEGEYLCVCGKSGCGKTTLLRQLKQALQPHGMRSGQIYFDGRKLVSLSEREQAQNIGFVMQNPDAQIVTDKVWHELAFGLESLGVDQATMRLRVAEMANYLGIQSWFRKDVHELSGGQKQLLNLASIMAMQPRVLILDEPTSQLDPIAASDFLNIIQKINRDLATTIIVTEHRLEEVFAAADRVLVMDEGRVCLHGSPREVGTYLSQNDNLGIKEAIPSAMRIFATLDAEGESPITVREGRQWLDSWLRAHSDATDVVGGSARAGGSAEIGARASVGAGDGGSASAGTAVHQLPLHSAYKEPPPRDCALRFQDVFFRYEKDAPDVLRGFSLCVETGKIHALLGGNGSGKSSALKLACGILLPYRGKISLFGRPLKRWSKKELFQGGLALLPQDPQSLFVKKSAQEELLEMLGELSPHEQAQELENIVALCHIEHVLERHPYDLSGGEQQRLALAKVLLCKPRVLLLDEPTKGMDASFKRELAHILHTLCAQGITVLIVSHDIEFCAQYAHAASLLFDGICVSTNTAALFFTGNNFYTTASNRMCRHVFPSAVTAKDVIALCQKHR